MANYLIKNATLINENKNFRSDVLIKNNRIERIDPEINTNFACKEINAEQLHLIPGAIDDQVHFREPGLTQKANIASESLAAVKGGVTSFMEMPNTIPPAFTKELLEEKYAIAAQTSSANYSFYLGTSQENYDELMRIDTEKVCGIKIFMGSSTGNLLVDDPVLLEKIFQNSPTLIATHCEDEKTINQNTKKYLEQFGESIAPIYHQDIRSREACFISSEFAISLAKKHGTKLHVLHISTLEELDLFDFEAFPNISNEACVHHLWFCDEDYAELGFQIKCNPAIKTSKDREALRKAVLENKISVIATDHAPHTWDEKQNLYKSAPSGLPLVQHSILMMWDLIAEGIYTKEHIVNKMSHAPAELFQIKDRGYLREGYFADVVLLNNQKNTLVTKESLAYKCAWSPLENHIFNTSIEATFVNGNLLHKSNDFEKDLALDMPESHRLLFQARK